MKIKPSKNMLYTIKAKVFSTKLGRDFSRTVHTTVIGNNKEDAIKQGEKSIKLHCSTLEKNHNNMFDYTDLEIE